MYSFGEDDEIARMEEQLKSRKAQWEIRTKKFEDEARRIEEEYERELAEIDLAAAKAAKEMEARFRAEKAAIMEEYRRESAGKIQNKECTPVANKSQLRPPCNSVLQLNPKINHQQTVIPQRKFFQPKSSLDTAVVMQDAEITPNCSSGSTLKSNSPVAEDSRAQVHISTVPSTKRDHFVTEGATFDLGDGQSYSEVCFDARSSLRFNPQNKPCTKSDRSSVRAIPTQALGSSIFFPHFHLLINQHSVQASHGSVHGSKAAQLNETSTEFDPGGTPLELFVVGIWKTNKDH